MIKRNDPFSLFGLRPSFNIDKDVLKKAYHSLCRVHHPDASTGDSGVFPEISRWYRVLENDLKRAEYLSKDRASSPGVRFLSGMIDYEEKISGLKDLGKLDAIRNEIEKRIDECRSKHNQPSFVARWRCLERLLKLLERRKRGFTKDA